MVILQESEIIYIVHIFDYPRPELTRGGVRQVTVPRSLPDQNRQYDFGFDGLVWRFSSRPQFSGLLFKAIQQSAVQAKTASHRIPVAFKETRFSRVNRRSHNVSSLLG